jgi:hypothetical protein
VVVELAHLIHAAHTRGRQHLSALVPLRRGDDAASKHSEMSKSSPLQKEAVMQKALDPPLSPDL